MNDSCSPCVIPLPRVILVPGLIPVSVVIPGLTRNEEREPGAGLYELPVAI